MFATSLRSHRTTCGFVFPGKTQERWKHGSEKVCALTGPGAALSIPGSLATRRQEQQPLAPRKGTFLHPALLGCRTMTKLLTRTHVQWPPAWMFSVCAHTDWLTAGWALWSLLPGCFWGDLAFRPGPTSCVREALMLGRRDQESGRKRGWCCARCDPLVVFLWAETRRPVLALPSFFFPLSASAGLFLSHPPTPLSC